MYATLDNASVSFLDKLIFKNVSVTINKGDRIGLIGANGAGKTTLLNTLTKKLIPEEGNVIYKSHLVIGFLQQNSGLDVARTIMEEMRDAFAYEEDLLKKMRILEEKMAQDNKEEYAKEYASYLSIFEHRDGYNIDVNINKVLNGMGFSNFDLSISALSGGEKTRLAIAKLLLENPQLLILDEPTNHLDFNTLKWLENYLQGYKGSIIVVSHDRYFLDKITNKIWEIEDKQLFEYKGNYTAFRLEKANKISFQTKEYEKQSRQIDAMKDYAVRNMARASTATRAKSRLKLLDQMEIIEKPKTQVKAPNFSFEFDKNSVNDVLTVADIDVCVGEEMRCIVKGVSFEIKKGEKVAIIGENGTGKSTLLKQLLKGQDINIVWGKNTAPGFYEQEHREFNPNNTALQEVITWYPHLLEYNARGALGRVLLTGENVYKHVKSLSGGERAKLGFAILMCGDFNVLVLDEPTNHLDFISRESLEGALQKYEGTLIFVSHDRYFVNALASRVFEISDSKLNIYEGNFDFYEESKYTQSGKREINPINKSSEKNEKDRQTPKGENRKEKRAQEAKRRENTSRVEKAMAEIEKEEAKLKQEIEENPADYQLLSDNCKRLQDLKQQYEAYMEEWILLDSQD